MDACVKLLAALPPWLMQDLSAYCGNVDNFLPNYTPSEEDIGDQAGK